MTINSWQVLVQCQFNLKPADGAVGYRNPTNSVQVLPALTDMVLFKMAYLYTKYCIRIHCELHTVYFIYYIHCVLFLIVECIKQQLLFVLMLVPVSEIPLCKYSNARVTGTTILRKSSLLVMNSSPSEVIV